MSAVTECVRSSYVMYVLLSILNHFAIVASCAGTTVFLFRTQPRKNAAFYALAALLIIAAGAARPALMNAGDLQGVIGSVILLALPFVCSLLLFSGKYIRQALITALGYTLIEAVKYVILLIFFRYDSAKLDDPTEMGVEIFVNAAFFLCVVGFLALSAKKRAFPFSLPRISPVLFVLICLTVGVFIASVVLFGSAPSAGRSVEFAFILLNIPLFTATIALSVSSLAKDKAREERYKNQLEMQVRHYEMMEQLNEEMRIFRHDFPKKLRPMIAYIDGGDAEKAKEIASQLDSFVQATGKRFHSGNARLDTVLFCEDQIARKDGSRIDFTFGSVFPQEGIAPDDIYTIFPNALDNAIEACRKTGQPCTITFSSRIVGDTVYVSIKNPIIQNVQIKNELPVTDKADKSVHGYGFRSIQRAAAKYGEDNVAFRAEDGVFELRLSLRIKNYK